jgi:hypothetical protein
MYKVEMKKFRDTIEEMKKEVLSIIYQVLLEKTVTLKKQCTGGKVNQGTFDSLNDVLARIDQVYADFIDRDDMKNMLDKVKKQVLGVDAEGLRSDESFKKKFGKAMTSIVNEIKSLPDIPLKRAIDF